MDREIDLLHQSLRCRTLIKSLKKYSDLVINKLLLNRINLRLTKKIGYSPLDDIKRLLRSQEIEIIIDGGAYKGDFSIEIAKAFPASTIYAFEPQIDSFRLLQSNTQHLTRVRPIRRAIGKDTGRAALYINMSPLTNSLLGNSASAEYYFKGVNDSVCREEVDVVALADFMEEYSLSYVDIVKLDLQGYELPALMGLGEQARTVKLFYLEVSFVQIYKDAALFSDIESYLRDKGFSFYQFYGLVRSPIDGRLLYGDALFINSHLLKSEPIEPK